MTTYYFSIYDRKAKAFGDLLRFYSNERAAVLRFFKDVVFDAGPSGESYYAKYCEDFDLYFIGTFDKTLGTFSFEEPEFIINASAYFPDRVEVEDDKE
ncbi:putative VP5 [Microviridae sp.]|nr:putative VP5 [Microviridae sp.]